MGGSRDPRLNQASVIVVLCRPCHDLIESRRDAARVGGWLVQRNADPKQVAIHSHLHGTVLLDDAGSVIPVGGDAA